MARQLRVHLPSAVYHVMLRGNGGQSIFFSESDRCRMSLLIQEGVERFGHEIVAFCFMTNHIHLAIRVQETSVSEIIQNLAFRYASYINNKYDRIGHVFQGRFKSILVDSNRYLKELVRYIHLNPVRANLVDQPEQYKWSGHRTYLNLDKCSWLSCDSVLKRYGNTQEESIVNYQEFVLQGIGVESEIDFKSGSHKGVLGEEEFVREFFFQVNKRYEVEIELADLLEYVCLQYKVSEKALTAPGKTRLESHVRSILALLVRETKTISMEELAKILNRDASGLGKLASRLEEKMRVSTRVKEEIDELRQKIIQMSECPA